ncbi:MAG: hypothetical protein HC919_07980 [Oscillatoriales cyanobacterium SM2_2_1]|nr:hypothetical protein [Oscillatoriales cyanobacterium SM2_2_1]
MLRSGFEASGTVMFRSAAPMGLAQFPLDVAIFYQIGQKLQVRGEFYCSCGPGAAVCGRMMRVHNIGALPPSQRARLRADVAIEGQLSSAGAEVTVGLPRGMPWNAWFQSQTGFEIRGDRLVPRVRNPHITSRSRLDLGSTAVTGILESSRKLASMAVEYGSVPRELVGLIVFLMAEDYLNYEHLQTCD